MKLAKKKYGHIKFKNPLFWRILSDKPVSPLPVTGARIWAKIKLNSIYGKLGA